MGSKYLPFFVFVFIISYSIKSAAGGDNGSSAHYYSESLKDSTDILSVFSAKIKDKTIYLNWRITNLKYISYFDIQRLDPQKKSYESITDKKIRYDDYFDKSANSEGLRILMYDYEDQPERDGVYYYRLRGFNSAGQIMFESDEIKIGISGLKNFKLEQNHPNPFNPSTVIKYELFSSTYVRLKVFDLIGREVTTLVDQTQSAGEYTVEFDASKFSNLTSGIYFYKLDTDNYSDVKKMILTK
jgi:hypothetical protein